MLFLSPSMSELTFANRASGSPSFLESSSVSSSSRSLGEFVGGSGQL